MFIRLLASALIVASSFLLVSGQTADAQRVDVEKAVKTSGAAEKKVDLPFAGGIDQQFIIKELARGLDLNVLFDVESFRGPRKTYVDLKNVTIAAALDYILLQDGLFFEEAGPKTILVASQVKRSIPQIGVWVFPLTEQLAQYFGVDGGILISLVRDNSPASKAGLRAGDVIEEIDGVSVKGPQGLLRAVNDKNEGNVILKVFRDHKVQTISLTPTKGIQSVL